jgi:hypothetical protein
VQNEPKKSFAINESGKKRTQEMPQNAPSRKPGLSCRKSGPANLLFPHFSALDTT